MDNSDGKVRYHRKETIPMGGSLQVIQGDDAAKNDGERANTTLPAWKEGRGKEGECLVNEQKQWERRCWRR